MHVSARLKAPAVEEKWFPSSRGVWYDELHQSTSSEFPKVIPLIQGQNLNVWLTWAKLIQVSLVYLAKPNWFNDKHMQIWAHCIISILTVLKAQRRLHSHSNDSSIKRTNTLIPIPIWDCFKFAEAKTKLFWHSIMSCRCSSLLSGKHRHNQRS